MADQERPGDQGEHGRPARPKRPSTGPSAAAFAGLGFQLAASIIALLYLGKWLDEKFGTAPVLLILGVFAGAAMGIYNMYHTLTAAQRDQERKRGDKK